MANGISKEFTTNTSEVFSHNGKTGVFLVGGTGSGTFTLSHSIGGEDVTIDTLSASGGTQFVSPLGKLKITTTNMSGSKTVIVRPLNEH